MSSLLSNMTKLFVISWTSQWAIGNVVLHNFFTWNVFHFPLKWLIERMMDWINKVQFLLVNPSPNKWDPTSLPFCDGDVMLQCFYPARLFFSASAFAFDVVTTPWWHNRGSYREINIYRNNKQENSRKCPPVPTIHFYYCGEIILSFNLHLWAAILLFITQNDSGWEIMKQNLWKSFLFCLKIRRIQIIIQLCFRIWGLAQFSLIILLHYNNVLYLGFVSCENHS